MIEYNKVELGKVAKEYGFIRDTYEKVLRLTEVLKFINSDTLLSKHLILKGGTAINLTIFDLPRLSVDIDLDFIPNISLEDMEILRKDITDRLTEYMIDNGYQLSASSRYSHSLDSLLFMYMNAGGNRDNIKVELNYSLRAHIFEPVIRHINSNAFDTQFEIRTVAPMEIFAAKINALLSRAAVRDLYDVNNMLEYNLFKDIDEELFRKCIIFYASVSSQVINKNFDTSAIDGLTIAKIKRDLFPVMRKKEHFDLEGRKKQAKDFISKMMVLTDNEKEYLNLFEQKIYKPQLLFNNDVILKNIANHPMAIWKMDY